MPISTPGIRVVHNFTRNGGEVAQTTHWVIAVPTAANDISQADLDVFTQNIADAFDALAWDPVTTGLKAYSSGGTIYRGAKAYFYPALSNVATRISEELVLDPSSGTSTFVHPYSDALVASLRTAVPTRSGKGRMYLPCNGVEMDGEGQYVSATVSNAATLVQGYLAHINSSSFTGLTDQAAGVASQVQGVARPVVQVIVDSLPDTQRRRDDKLNAKVTETRAVTP